LTPLLLALAASKATLLQEEDDLSFKVSKHSTALDIIGSYEVSPLTSNLKGKNLLTTALDMGETIVEATEAC